MNENIAQFCVSPVDIGAARAEIVRQIVEAFMIGPEDTLLRAAGIDEARQAEYQRKMSQLLSG